MDPKLGNSVRACLEPKEEVLEAYLFGSQARGDQRAHSDVDVAVYLAPATGREAGFGADAELTEALMAALGRSDVDLVVLNQAGPLLYHRALSAPVAATKGHRLG